MVCNLDDHHKIEWRSVRIFEENDRTVRRLYEINITPYGEKRLEEGGVNSRGRGRVHRILSGYPPW